MRTTLFVVAVVGSDGHGKTSGATGSADSARFFSDARKRGTLPGLLEPDAPTPSAPPKSIPPRGPRGPRGAGDRPSKPSALVVELVGVTKTYPPNVRALRAPGVSAKFVEGRVSVVLGANGSGKSTLLSILGTLAQPTSGRVSHGVLGKTREVVRASLGWVGHDALCYADLTGRENIELAARLHGISPAEAYESARERFPTLSNFAQRPFRTYSRGQRQRVALARALVHDPRLILLDEPTTGLDKDGTKTLLEVVRAEARRGAVVVVVTHDERFGDEVGDERLVLEGGSVKEATEGVR